MTKKSEKNIKNIIEIECYASYKRDIIQINI